MAVAQEESKLVEFLEFRSCTDLKVDRKEGIIRGVKVLGQKSANVNPDGSQNIYTFEARSKAIDTGIYENIGVNIDHPDRNNPGASRSYRDRVGHLRNVVNTQEGLFGDLHLNMADPISLKIIEDAEKGTRNVGLSHNAQGRGRIEGNECLIEEITSARSVDIVANPATTQSLFESQLEGSMPVTVQRDVMEGDAATYAEEAQSALSSLMSGEASEAEMREQLAAIAQMLMDRLAEGAAEDAETGEGEGLAVTTTAAESKHSHLEEIKLLRQRIDELETTRAAERRVAQREKLLRESRLPEQAISEVFRATFMEASDEQASKLIEDRRSVWFDQRPRSRDAGRPVKELSKKGFMESLTGRGE